MALCHLTECSEVGVLVIVLYGQDSLCAWEQRQGSGEDVLNLYVCKSIESMVIDATTKAVFGNVQRQEFQKWKSRAKPKVETFDLSDGVPSSIKVTSKHLNFSL